MKMARCRDSQWKQLIPLLKNMSSCAWHVKATEQWTRDGESISVSPTAKTNQYNFQK